MKLLTLAIYQERCVKENCVREAVFMFELTLYIYIYILFCPLIVLQRGISSSICDLVLSLFSEG